jgi:hypothetical protein
LRWEADRFGARRRDARRIPRIVYDRDQASLVDAVQDVVDHRLVLREINIDMDDPVTPFNAVVTWRTNALQDMPAMLSLVVWTRGMFARVDSFMS